MTEQEVDENFPWLRVVDEDHPKTQLIDQPARCAPEISSGYTGEVAETTELAEALQLAQRPNEWALRGGIREKFGEQSIVRVYFWKIRP